MTPSVSIFQDTGYFYPHPFIFSHRPLKISVLMVHIIEFHSRNGAQETQE